MASSQEVFALRKAGSLNEAYAMAFELIEANPDDEWTIKAFAWCLYDLVKRSVSQNDYETASTYITQLDALQINELDDILLKSIEHAKVLACPEKRIVLQAKEKSRQGNHQEALILFRQAIQQFPDDIDLHTQFAWELQKEGKIIFDAETVDVQKARKLLAEYIKLKNERPSRLHSLFLRFADKIIDRVEFNLISFLKLWDLNNLMEDDFESFTKDKKTYPSIAEKIIQHGAKLILDKKMNHEAGSFLQFVDIGIERFKDNIWLTYYKAKLLHLINRNEDAIGFLIPVIKEKTSEYWVWSLLAELVIESDIEKAISCYCKSLLCKGEDKFMASVRIKFAELLIQKEHWNEAKHEIVSAIRTKETEGVKVSDRLKDYQQKEWYKNATDKKSNNDYYYTHKHLAEEFVFHSLPWIDGCLGETFTIPEKPDKPRRKLFIRPNNEIIEFSVSDRKFNTSRNYKVGDAIRVKGEFNKENILQLYLLDKRNTIESWDLFDWNKGNIIHPLKNDKDRITAWRVSVLVGEQLKEGIIDTKNITGNFQMKPGIPVFVKYYQKVDPFLAFFTLRGEGNLRVQILTINERTEGSNWDLFPESIGVIDHINNEKGIAHLIVSKEMDCTIKLNQIKEKVEVGSILSVKLKKVTKENDYYYTVLRCSITQQEPPEELLKSFYGIVEIAGSVGFASNVFIDSTLIEKHQISHESFVSGRAIINYNKKKRIWGWKAIEIKTAIPIKKKNSANDENKNQD